jgi:hypothetical protein
MLAAPFKAGNYVHPETWKFALAVHLQHRARKTNDLQHELCILTDVRWNFLSVIDKADQRH